MSSGDPEAHSPSDPYDTSPADAGSLGQATDKETNQWALMLHLSQFAGFIVPVAGFVAPIIIWQLKKNDLPGLDIHGRIVTIWMLSELVYAVVLFLMMLTIILIPVVWIAGMVLGVVGVVYPILGAIKANDGIVWKYPGSISFF